MRDPSISPELLAQYLAGAATPEDVSRVRYWLAGDPRRHMVLTALQRLDTRAGDADLGVGELWAGIADRIAADDGRRRDGQSGMRGVWVGLRRIPLRSGADSLRRIVYGFAGLAVIIGVALYQRVPHDARRTTSRSYATTARQTARIQLADGSRIILAPRTRVTVLVGADESRLVTLVGEARFEIISRLRAPFEVRTGSLVTRVLGTTFDVRRYPEERSGRVVVLDGKVTTSWIGQNRPVTLTAGMIAHFEDSTVIQTKVADPTPYTDWAKGRLVFRDVPVPVVLETLGRWYGYTFNIADSTLVKQHVTATFALGETSEMLQLLKRVLGVDMTLADSIVTLRPAREATVPTTPVRYKMHDPISTLTEVGR